MAKDPKSASHADPPNEDLIRSLLSEGKSKTALDGAKELYKALKSSASESLLLDAYAARIRSLLDQNLAVEAKALLDLVRQRFPASKDRFDRLVQTAAVKGGDLDGMLRDLADPTTGAERRASIEQAIQEQVTDLTAIASSAALPPDHGLRQAATALHAAFVRVTSGRVTEAQIALPEVSRRSPLAPWKTLIRAIACLYKDEDDACRASLDAIPPESAPYRLAPAIRAILGDNVPNLTSASAALVSETLTDFSDVREALADLDRELPAGDEVDVSRAVKKAVRVCRDAAPSLLNRLKQRIAIAFEMNDLDVDSLPSLLGGEPRRDAQFLRMEARSLERTGSTLDRIHACEIWDSFRQAAIRENWFAESGIEVAVLYLHMAELLAKITDESALAKAQRTVKGEDGYFLFPDKLYARSCAIDPHPETYACWLRLAANNSDKAGGRVALEWSRIRPGDLQPVLFLMKQAESDGAYLEALARLETAERIDAVHPEVRSARLRLLAGAAIGRLRKGTAALVEEAIAAFEALPQASQGDRAAFAAALRYIANPGTEPFDKVERILGNPLAANLLISGVAAIAGRPRVLPAMPAAEIKHLGKPVKAGIPSSVARVLELTGGLGLKEFFIPKWIGAEVDKQFKRAAATLDIQALWTLGNAASLWSRPKMVWAASTEGLKRGGPSETRFLAMRATALPAGILARYIALVAAASALGRFHRDMDAVDAAASLLNLRQIAPPKPVSPEQARLIVEMELASPAFPSRTKPGPNYRSFVPEDPDEACQCPDCRCARGDSDFFDDGDDSEDEADDFPFFDEIEMRAQFEKAAPKGMPRDLLDSLFEMAKNAYLTGMPIEEALSRLVDLDAGAKGGKKGRGKK